MLLVGIPLLLQVRLPVKQKIILLLIFGMGIFVIVAAILTKVYCLVPALISYVYMKWYFREATVAMLVTNLPLVWSLIREVFPALRSWVGGSKRTDSYRWTSNKKSGLRQYAAYGRSGGRKSADITMHDYPATTNVTPNKGASDTSLHPSDERDLVSDDGSARALRIRQDVTVTVESEPHSSSPENFDGRLSQPRSDHYPV